MKTLILILLLLATQVPAHAGQPDGKPAAGKRAAVQVRRQARPRVSAWRLKLSSSGGFSGRGGGEVSITSRGEVVAGRPPVSTQVAPACEGKLRPTQLRALSRAVSAARPATWRKRYIDPQNPDGCCDQFSFQLELELKRSAAAPPQSYTTGWHEGAAKFLPKELREILTAATAAHQHTLENCK